MGAALSTSGQGDRALDELLRALSIPVAVFLNVATHGTLRKEKRDELRARADALLAERKPDQLAVRRPFHWALAFPEVMASGGFHAFVGNPPFMGGQKITAAVGTDYRDFLVEHLAQGCRGSADVSAYFFLRVCALLRTRGGCGLLATNTIAQGDTRDVGLDALLQKGLGAAPSRRRQVVGFSRLEGINAGRELLLRSRRADGAPGTRSPDHERSENQSDRVC